jgi:hypothetical protein
MRTEVLDYIKTLSLGSFNVSEELPRADSGASLYLKNPKRIYVDRSQFEESPAIRTLGSLMIHNYVERVNIYFTVDAKLLPKNYADLIEDLQAAKSLDTTSGYISREADVSTEYVNDLLLTNVTLTYTKLR